VDELEIFDAARRLSAAKDRTAYLDEVCGSNAELRARVETLLRSSEVAGSFLESPASALLDAAETPDPTMPTDSVGPGSADHPENGVLGDYRILREIGRGGMGVVYEAEQISLGRTVALKVMPFAAMLNKTQLARFKNEARAAASLDHPNVVHVHSVGTERGVHYYAMQFIDGQTAGDLIAAELRRRGCGDESATGLPARSSGYESTIALPAVHAEPSSRPQGLKETERASGSTTTTHVIGDERARIRGVVELAIQAAHALEHAHRMGIVHRDIKPSNLLVDAEHHLWVTDFGLAMIEAEGNLTATGGMLGTLRYMSPEQMRGDRHVLDHHTDIYSLGATLYEMLTLQPAFPEGDVARLMQRIPNDEPVSPRKLNPAIHRDLETIVLKAMAKDHEDRYSTAGDMAADLQRHLDDEPIRAKPPGPIERVKKAARRHRAVVVTAAATLCVAIAVASALLWRERSETFAALARETNQRRIADKQKGIAQQQERLAKVRKALADQRLADAVKQQDIAAQATRQLLEQLYVSDMKLASDAFHAGDLPRVSELLDRHPATEDAASFHGFEWHYLRKAITIRPVVMSADVGRVQSIRQSDDGRQLAVVFRDGRVRIHDTRTFSITDSFSAEDQSNGIAWSPEGGRIAVARADGSVGVWDRTTGSRALLIEAHDGEANDLLFSRDGAHLITSGDDDRIRLWDTATGAAEFSLDGHEREVEELALSPDGQLLASASSDGTVRLWDWKRQQELGVWSHDNGRVVCVAFSPQGKHVAAGSISGHLLLADVASRESKVLAKHSDGIESIAFMPDGRAIVTGDRGGSVRFWPIGSDDQHAQSELVGGAPHWIASESYVDALAVTPDGHLVSGPRKGRVAVWAPDLDGMRWQNEGISAIALGSRGELFMADREIHTCDVPRRRITASFLPSASHWAEIAVSADGRRLAAGVGNCAVVFDLDERRVIARRTLRGEIRAIALSPDGERVAVGQRDARDSVKFIGVSDPERDKEIDVPQLTRLAFSPDGRLLAVGTMDDVRVYAHDGSALLADLRGHTSTLADLAFSPDGRFLVTVSHDRRMALWDVESRQNIYSVRAHSDWIYAVAYSPDGRVIATGGKDKMVKLWHAATGQQLLELPAEADNIWRLTFHPDGRHLVCGLISAKCVIYDASGAFVDEKDASGPIVTNPASAQEPPGRPGDDAEFLPIGPTPEEGWECLPTGISSDGSVVVGFVRSGWSHEMFRWCRESGTTPLGVPPGHRLIAGPRISPDGDVVFAILKTPAGRRLAVWRGADALPRLKELSTADPDLHLARLEASSHDGSRMTGECKNLAGDRLACWWDGEVIEVLPTPGTGIHSHPVTVADHGDVVFGRIWRGSPNEYASDTSNLRPACWAQGRFEHVSGFGDEEYNWLLHGVSADAQVMVGDRWPKGTSGPVAPAGSQLCGLAFRWHAGRVEVLGELPGGYVQSTAEAISADGRIIVGGSHIGPRQQAWIWEEQHGMRPIESVLRQRGVALQGWTLSCGGFVSADGRIIVGWGNMPSGRVAAWWAHIPPDM
jgi:WD40 repeat protein/serine/threonine protein kinase